MACVVVSTDYRVKNNPAAGSDHCHFNVSDLVTHGIVNSNGFGIVAN